MSDEGYEIKQDDYGEVVEEEAIVAKESTASSFFDPIFSTRAGKTLTWSNVQMTIQPAKKDKEPKVILRNGWGEAPAKKVTAIMGPSGAGKTSLLNVLSGRTSTSGKLTVTGDVRLNNVTVDPTSIGFRKRIAFVAQDDSLMVSATPRECIRFSAKLRLGREATNEEIENLTTQMLADLGLESAADTVVGGELLKGISGGERKRTSVGVELITKPNMVFLDEPTSGLDSFSAVQLCQVLGKVAKSGASVMLTIHQPSSDILEGFDFLILMNKGRVMYHGPVDNMDEYFAARQHPLPPKYNPADWVMIVAQSTKVETLEEQGFFEDDHRPQVEPGSEDLSDTPKLKRNHVGLLTQLNLLVGRDLLSLKRDKQVLGARLMLTTFTSVLVGIIFWQVGGTDSGDFSNLQSHFGAEIMVLMIALLTTALPVMIIFPAERPVFVREYSTNHYSIISYFVSRLVMEVLLTGIQVLLLAVVSYFMVDFQLNFFWHYVILYATALSSNAIAVMLGSAVADPKIAIEFLPMLIMPQLLFAGFFISIELIPNWLSWLTWVFPLTYAVRLHMAEEFGNCGPPGSLAQINCDNLLDSVVVDEDLIWMYWLLLILLFALLRIAALGFLTDKARKFY